MQRQNQLQHKIACIVQVVHYSIDTVNISIIENTAPPITFQKAAKLKSLVTTHAYDDVWIGGKDVNGNHQFSWVGSGNLLATTGATSYWDTDEPDLGGSDKDCVLIDEFIRRLRTEKCASTSEEFSFICEKY